MRTLMYKVEYALHGIGSETKMALFTDRKEAEHFRENMFENKDFAFVYISKWSWAIEIED